MTSIALIFLFTWNVIFLNEIYLALAGNECSSNSDCSAGQVCCTGFSGSSCQVFTCFGRHCSTDGDCGGVAECCRFNRCGRFGCVECHSNSYCASSEYCCQHRYIDDHNVCRRSCVGETCHSSSDCGGPGEYCASNNLCKKSAIHLAGWVIPICVIGLLLFAVVCAVFFLHRWFQRRFRRHNVVNCVGPSTAVTALQEMATHNSLPPPAYNSPTPYFNQAKTVTTP